MVAILTTTCIISRMYRLRHFSFSTFDVHHDTKSLAMGRKRNQGKARKAAKAKEREEAEERMKNKIKRKEAEDSYEEAKNFRSQLQCVHVHGAGSLGWRYNICCRFATAFVELFNKTVGDGNRPFWDRLIEARNASVGNFACVLADSANIESAMSYLLCDGAQYVLEGSYDDARDRATIVRYFEQYIAVQLHETQALYNRPKIGEVYIADLRTLVKFFWKRIPCSCLDEKYEEVKGFPKMGFCYNLHCSIPNSMSERSKTMCCSRCRNVTYCSRECQVADWASHKLQCDRDAEAIAKFQAKQQNT